MTIGVFDSGAGGRSVEVAIKQAFPVFKTIYASDKSNLPYGNKTPNELLRLVTPILQDMANRCDIIVVACNSVTTTIIEDLRKSIKIPLIGIEPMVKPAAEVTKSGVIAVCATPTTLRSERYVWLKKTYASDVEVLEPDCSDWAAMIEHKQMDEHKVADRINRALEKGADVIVLACTHYHWIQDLVEKLSVGRARVIQPEEAIVARLKTVMEEVLSKR